MGGRLGEKIFILSGEGGGGGGSIRRGYISDEEVVLSVTHPILKFKIYKIFA